MRTTIEIQDALFRRAKSVTALKGLSLRNFINSAVVHELERLGQAQETSVNNVTFPLVPSQGAKSVSLSNARVNELLEEDDLNAVS